MNHIITIDGIDYIGKGSTIPADPRFDALRDAYLEFGIEDRINIATTDGLGMYQAYLLIDGSYKMSSMSTDRDVAAIANRMGNHEI